jgi:hypothetical protein
LGTGSEVFGGSELFGVYLIVPCPFNFCDADSCSIGSDVDAIVLLLQIRVLFIVLITTSINLWVEFF